MTERSGSQPVRASVIVPNYNHARFLPARIDSILAQRYQDFELILLDDASTDGSQQILASYAQAARARFVRNEANSGRPATQWNKGVAMAVGEYVWIAESDDTADPELLGTLIAALDAHPRASFAYCRSQRLTEDGQCAGFQDSGLVSDHPGRWENDFVADGRDECGRFFIFGNPVVNASAVVFRRSAYLAAGGADETYRWCSDWKLWAGMALQGELVYRCEALNYFRLHGRNHSEQACRSCLQVEESMRALRWILSQVGAPPALVRASRRSLAPTWIGAITSGVLPWAERWAVFKHAVAFDPEAIPRLALPMLAAVRAKMALSVRSVRRGGAL